MEVAKFREYVSRLQKVQIAVNELLIKRGPGAGEQTFFESADTRDPIEKCLAEAEKLRRNTAILIRSTCRSIQR